MSLPSAELEAGTNQQMLKVFFFSSVLFFSVLKLCIFFKEILNVLTQRPNSKEL